MFYDWNGFCKRKRFLGQWHIVSSADEIFSHVIRLSKQPAPVPGPNQKKTEECKISRNAVIIFSLVRFEEFPVPKQIVLPNDFIFSFKIRGKRTRNYLRQEFALNFSPLGVSRCRQLSRARACRKSRAEEWRFPHSIQRARSAPWCAPYPINLRRARSLIPLRVNT